MLRVESGVLVLVKKVLVLVWVLVKKVLVKKVLVKKKRKPHYDSEAFA